MSFPSPLRNESGPGRVVITVAGANRPGIVAAFSKVLARAQVDIQDLSQRVVEGLFVMLIVGDLTNAQVSLLDLRGELSRLADEQRLQVSVQHEKLFRFLERV